MIPTFESPLCFALDVVDTHEAERFMDLLAPHVGAFKIGPELLLRAGPSIVGRSLRPVVLDLKLHDIPETVARTVSAAGDLDGEIRSNRSQDVRRHA